MVVRRGRVVRFQTDYILGSDCQIFHNVAVRGPMHNYDHFLVVGCLCGSSLREHSHYLGCSTRFSLRPPSCQTRTRADNLFAGLRRAILKPGKQAACHNSWILSETWILFDERVSASQEPGRDYRRLQRLVRAIRAVLKEDRKWLEMTEGEDVERLLTRETSLPYEAWRRM